MPIWVFLQSLLIQSAFANGMVITLFDKHLDYSTRNEKVDTRFCRNLFPVIRYGSKVMMASPDGFRQSSMVYYNSNVRPAETVKALENILASMREWESVSEANIETLRGRDHLLPPMRTKYVTIEHEGHTSGIRIIDASDNPFNFGMPWISVPSGSSARTLIELLYNYNLPERYFEKPAFIWELGLLGSSKHFKAGSLSALSHVAFALDSHYNKMNFRVFGDLSVIKELDFQIYAIARPVMVPIYKKMGFATLPVIDSRGVISPFAFPDGMVLIKMTGSDFIERYFFKPAHPATVNGREAEDAESVRETLLVLHKINREVDVQRPSGLTSWPQFLGTWKSIVQIYGDQFMQSPVGSKERQNAYFDLVRTLHILLKSELVDSNDPSADFRRIMIKELLVEGPEYGWQAFQYLMDNQSERPFDYRPSHFRFDF